METTYVIRSAEIWHRAANQLNLIPPADPPMWEVTIRKHVKSKTSQQRKYFHAILQEVCKQTGGNSGLSLKDAVEDLKLEIKYRVLPLKEVRVGDSVYLHPISSENATVAQYADLITASLMYANAAGVTIPDASHWGYKI